MEADSLTLDTVLSDLATIATTVLAEEAGGAASYESVQQQLDGLSLHVLTYLRFLEDHDYIVYDRSADRIALTELGRAAASDAEVWRMQASAEFLQDNPITSDDPLGELTGDVDDILDSIGDLDVGAALSEASSANPTTQLSPPQSFAPSTTMNDSFSSRRLGTQQSPAARPPATNLYDRIEAIGSGGMGTVYRGTQVKLKRDVAIKEIKEIFDVFAGVQRDDIIARFTEIVQTQATLLHPNVIQVVDLDTDAQYPSVVMQFAPNGNLRRLIESEGRPPLQTALKYFLQILHALNTAHDLGVTHGGIKPENVVLDHAGNALMTDFGISRVAELDGNGGANQVYVGVGTVAYMSPEQFRDPNIATVRSDVYSLGIMFYEMLTGKVPGRRSPMPSSFFPDIPRALDDIFDRMCMDDVTERYESVEQILTDIYGSEDVMSILDKRGGFLFLRDPMVHGDGGGIALFDDASPAVARPDAGLGDAASRVEDDGEPVDDGDVLGKLDKYSGMFEAGDEDSDLDEDSDADDDD